MKIKNLFVCLLSVSVLVSMTSKVQGSQVYGTETFSISESSRSTDAFGFVGPGKEVTPVAFDIWSLSGIQGKGDVWLGIETVAVDIFRYHNPSGTLEMGLASGTTSDITDIHLENTQGETVAVGRWATTLPPSQESKLYSESYPVVIDQLLFESVQPQKQFLGGTFFVKYILSNKFATGDVIGVGLRKIVVKNSTGTTEVCEPYPEFGDSFISSGSWFVKAQEPARLDRIEPGYPRAGEEVVLHGEYFRLSDNAIYIRYPEGGINGGLFKALRAESEDGTTLRFRIPEDVPPGQYRLLVNNGIVWPSNELVFQVIEPRVEARIDSVSPSPATLGVTLTISGSGFRVGNGFGIFNSVDIRNLSGVSATPKMDIQATSADGKTLTFPLPAEVGPGVYTISVYNWQGGVSPLIQFAIVSATPSGNGGGGGVPVIVTSPEPRPPSELPGREVALQEAPWYRRGPLPAGGTGWWCFVRLTEPLPEKAAVWWDSEWAGQYPVPMVGVNGDGTFIGFPLVYNISHLTEGRLGEIGKVWVFDLTSGP